METMSTSGDDEQRSANDEFMDAWADDDYYEQEHRRGAPGLLPGALLGAGVAALCAIGIYLLADGGDGGPGATTQTVTYTKEGPTQTVTQQRDAAPAGDSTFTETTTVTQPPHTVTVKVVQPGENTTLTTTATATVTATTTATTTVSAPPQTTTVTRTTTVTSTGIVLPTHQTP